MEQEIICKINEWFCSKNHDITEKYHIYSVYNLEWDALTLWYLYPKVFPGLNLSLEGLTEFTDLPKKSTRVGKQNLLLRYILGIHQNHNIYNYKELQ